MYPTNSNDIKPVTFFVIDDDVDDRELFKEALLEIDRNIRCITAQNGEEALHMLRMEVFEIDPDYIFLDLNMPRINGQQCLREIKSMPRYSSIPVIIYSTSSAKKDIEESSRLGAAKFITKPSSFDELRNQLEALINNNPPQSTKKKTS